MPFNYTRISWSQIYNQVLVEHSYCIKIITNGDLKPLCGISKSQARLLVLEQIQEEKEFVDLVLAHGCVSKLLHEVAIDLGLNLL